jgi:glutamyl-tRNA synthetase
LPIYHKHANELLARGHLYKCWCSCSRLEEVNDDAEENSTPPGYDRRCRNLTDADKAAHEASGKPYVLRLRAPLDGVTVVKDPSRGDVAFDNKTLSDMVMLKSDGFPTYHLASVIDDHLMEISHILRGDEWLATAPLHVLLYKFFGWEPPVMVHLAKVLGSDGKKLSKRDGAANLVHYLDVVGALPEPLLNRLALTGWGPGNNKEVLTPEERIAEFDIARVVASDAIFDMVKLAHYNGAAIREKTADEFRALAMPFLVRGGIVSDNPTEAQSEYVSKVLPLLQSRIKLLGEAPGKVRYLYSRPELERDKLLVKGLDADKVDNIFSTVYDALDALPVFDAATVGDCLRGVAADKGLKKVLFTAVGAALSGEPEFLPLFESIELLGKTEVLERLTIARAVLASPATPTT